MLIFKEHKIIWYYVLHTTIFCIYICIRKYTAMEYRNNNSYHTLAALIHISTFSKYFVPLGNFIFPLIIWFTGKKEKLIDHYGKEALNFQLSIFFYMVLVAFASIAGFILISARLGFENVIFPEDLFRITQLSQAVPLVTLLTVAGVFLLGLFILELVCVIVAAIKASEGEYYHYPLSINFISDKTNSSEKNSAAATEEKAPAS